MKSGIAPILVLLFTSSLLAQKSDEERVVRRGRISKQSSTVSGDRGLFTISSVDTLNKGQFSFGVGVNNYDRTPKDIDVNSYPVYFSYGLLRRLTITGTFETKRQVTARNLPQPGFFNSLPFVEKRFSQGYGDTVLSVKYQIKRRSDNVGGVSLKGFVKFGTADSTQGLGTGKTDVGVDLIFSSLLPLGFLLHSTMGFTSTTDAKTPVAIGIRDELRSGIGTAWPAQGLKFLGRTFQGIFEYSSITFVGGGTPNRVKQSPTDVAFGLRYLMLDTGITVDAGFRKNRVFDFSFPGNTNNNGFVGSVTYTKPVAAIANNHFPLVVLEAQPEEIPVGGTTTITATGFDADNDPLSYSWSSSGGKIAGSGEKVTFDATGAATGTYTIRVIATDGRGGRAQSEVQVTVRP